MHFSAVLVALATALAFFYIARVVIRVIEVKRAGEDDDSWRDAPPIFYTLLKPFIRTISPDLKPLIPHDTYEKIKRTLRVAGMNYAILPEEYVVMRYLYLIIGLGVSFYIFRTQAPHTPNMYLLMFSLPLLFFFYPALFMRTKAADKRKRIVKEFPFLLDLMVLAMRAGLNYSQSLAQAVNSIKSGPIKDEYGIMLREIAAGKARSEAHDDLAKRVEVEIIDNFVAAMNQAEETGGELVSVLVTQSKQRRKERFLAAEELAGKAPVKMLLPLMVFLFPVIFMLVGFVLLVGLGQDGVLPPAIWEKLN